MEIAGVFMEFGQRVQKEAQAPLAVQVFVAEEGTWKKLTIMEMSKNQIQHLFQKMGTEAWKQ